jgi:hypothetical protein
MEHMRMSVTYPKDSRSQRSRSAAANHIMITIDQSRQPVAPELLDRAITVKIQSD